MAVYTDVSFEELEVFLAAYDLGEPHVFKGIAEGVSNSNYFLQTEKGTFILTLYEMRVEVEDLPFYLGLMEHLAAAGIRCPTPVRARNGAVTGLLNGRAAALLTFLDGVSLRRPTAEHCQQAGVALAELHKAGANFAGKRANALGPAGWRKLADDCVAEADNVVDGLRALIQEELAALEAAWPIELPQGVIHADLFPDNVLFVNDHVSGIIDFYFACNDALAYDLAVTLNAWCFENDGAFNVTKGRSLIAGYQSKRTLQPDEKTAFPLLCRGAALRFLLTRTYDWVNRSPTALVMPKDPREFAKRLRFHRNAKSAEAYGL
ncbi:MAG TPA: homoserine kinase [Micropepsaceae bacterium]|nr:homoserine kinase [Micropepsaceae bacterium]